MKTAAPIILSPEEASTLDTWVRGGSLPLRLVQRVRIVRMAADGVQSQDIATRLGVSRPTVQLWRQRFLAFRLMGKEKDAPRPDRIAKITPKKIQAVDYRYKRLYRQSQSKSTGVYMDCTCTTDFNQNRQK